MHVPAWSRLCMSGVLLLAVSFAACAWAAGAGAEAVKPSRTVCVLKTESGVTFGTWGNPFSSPAPTLFVLAGTIQETLGQAYFRQAGNVLAEQGYLLVSVDLPCHGPGKRADEPPGLNGWRARSERNEDFVAETNSRLVQVLDHLIAAGRTDPDKVAACGTSRGGFLALHFAASDPRVRCVAAFAPVTDLGVLREFQGAAQLPLVRALDLADQAGKLAGRAVWLVIGDQDERVGTDHTVALARRITAASIEQRLLSRVELHVMPEPRGHTTPSGAAEQAAAWISRQLESPTE